MMENNTPKYLAEPGLELAVPPEALRPSWVNAEIEPERPTVPLAHYLWILRRHRWKLLSFIFGCVAATAIVSSRLTPIYEATTTVDIDRQVPTSIIGQDSMRPPVNDSDQFIATQVKLIQSDSVLRPVAQQYHLLEFDKGEKSSDAEEN